MKGVIHFHSNYSYDSINSLDSIIDKAIAEELDFLILTDHDTAYGSLALKRRVAEREAHLIVPMAAEYKTEYGDIIAAFISHEIQDMSFINFIEQVKKQNGVLLLPHPYEGHPKNLIETIAKSVDIIETYNPRCTSDQDSRAKVLAKKLNKPEFFGSDAHLPSELLNVVVYLEGEASEEGLKHAILNNKMKLLRSEKIYVRNITLSQFIKSFKQKKFSIFFRNAVGLLLDSIRLGWNRRIL